MIVDSEVALEVACHEAIIREAYKDSVGKWTWSVGLTSATGHNVERYINKPQPLQHCMNVYVWALDKYADHVREVLPGIMSKNEFAAILSWTWNLGGGALRKASWVKHFKAGRMKEAEASFKSWNRAGGKVSPGLVKRRQAEADLLFRGIWSNKGTMTEYAKLTSKSTPDWGSARAVNVTKELERAFGADRPELDAQPNPKAKQKPTISPDVDLVVHNLFQLFFDWLRKWWNAS